MRSNIRLSLQIAGTLLLPFLCLTIYLATVARNGSSESRDGIALLVSIAAGGVVLMTAPLKLWEKVIVALCYTLLMGLALLGYAFHYVCSAYGRCL